jgi:putative ATP-binding cassette transporter
MERDHVEANLAIPTLTGGLRGKPRSWPDFLGRFIRVAGPYWLAEERWRARSLTAVLVVLTIGQVVIPIALNIWTENLFEALARQSMTRFTYILGLLAVIIGANVLIVTTHLRVKRRLQVGWREWLTRRTLGEWMASGHQYQVTYMPGEHDNPDGRIAEDIRIATEFAVDLVHSLFYSVLLLAGFVDILWSLSGPGEIEVAGMSLRIPGHLVWVAVAYAAIGTIVALTLGRPLVRATDSRQTYEANFRFGLVHARENTLPIALVQGEGDERRRLSGLFRGAAGAWDRQTNALVNIFYYLSSWSVLSQVFPILVAAPRYIAGSITLGALMQTAQGFQQAIAALSWPTDNLSKLADWRASAERMMGLHDAIVLLIGRKAAEPGALAVSRADKPTLAFSDVVVADPDGETVIARFSSEIGAGERVMISGEPGAADKLFKAAAGLWPWGSGRILLPAGAEVFFAPQRPYLPIGPLCEAVSYPDTPDRFGETEIAAALRRVGLDHLAQRLIESDNWEQSLNIGDQQRLGIARLLLHRPGWIFLQEATDALDSKEEAEMMQLLGRTFEGATVITIAHHGELEPFHQRKLALMRKDGVVVVEEVPIG